MPTPDEDLASSAILDRVRADLIVRALLDEKKKEPPRAGFWTHPMVSLLATFILTTVLGTWLATLWQTNQWTEQQEYTARQELAKARMDVMNSLVQKVGQNFAAAQDIMALYQHEHQGKLLPKRDEEMQRRLSRWTEQNRRWRVEEPILKAQIQQNFSDPRIAPLLKTIVANRQKLATAIDDFLAVTGGGPAKPEPEIVKLFNDAFTAIVDTTGGIYGKVADATGGPVGQICSVMIEETRRDRDKPTPWSTLRARAAARVSAILD